jgi:hypothetical protein
MSADPQVDLSFRATYEIEVLNQDHGELSVQVIEFSPVRASADRSLIARFSTMEKSWIGKFCGASDIGIAEHAIYGTPHELMACIISGGQGYLVDVAQPNKWSEISVFPIIRAVPIPDANTLVLVDFQRLSGVAEEGTVSWTTPKISWDGIEVSRYDSQALYGFAWSAPKNCQVEFAVDLRTGRVTGGAVM